MPMENVTCPECDTPLHTDGWIGQRGVRCVLGCQAELSDRYTVAGAFL